MLSLSERREIQDWRDSTDGRLNDPEVEVDGPDAPEASKGVDRVIVRSAMLNQARIPV